jgi:hypothetical protein
MDCLIIASPKETGPLTGVEAMASGKLIPTTPVGAMKWRINNLDHHQFFVPGNIIELRNAMLKSIQLSQADLKLIRQATRHQYLRKNRKYSIKIKYWKSLY